MEEGVVLIGLVALVAGAFSLSLSARWLRFRRPSLSTSFGSMAVAIGVAVVGVLVMPKIFSFWAAVGVGMGFVAVAGMISVAYFFREPVWKTAAATGFVLVGEILCLGVGYVVIGLLFALGAIGLSR